MPQNAMTNPQHGQPFEHCGLRFEPIKSHTERWGSTDNRFALYRAASGDWYVDAHVYGAYWGGMDINDALRFIERTVRRES